MKMEIFAKFRKSCLRYTRRIPSCKFFVLTLEFMAAGGEYEGKEDMDDGKCKECFLLGVGDVNLPTYFPW